MKKHSLLRALVREYILKEFKKSSLDKQDRGFDLPPADGDDGGGGGGGGDNFIFLTHWYELPRLSLIQPKENELNVETKGYIDPSIENPDHYFFDSKTAIKEAQGSDRDTFDVLNDMMCKALFDLTADLSNVQDDGVVKMTGNWKVVMHPGEGAPLTRSLRVLPIGAFIMYMASHKTDNMLRLEFYPKSHDMKELLTKEKGIAKHFKNCKNLLVDHTDSRFYHTGTASDLFWFPLLSPNIEEIDPFDFSSNRYGDIEAIKEAIQYTIEECDLMYDLGFYVSSPDEYNPAAAIQDSKSDLEDSDPANAESMYDLISKLGDLASVIGMPTKTYGSLL